MILLSLVVLSLLLSAACARDATDFPSTAFDVVLVPDNDGRRRLQDDDDLVVQQCIDATELFRQQWDRQFNGTNQFVKYFDCQCEGDLASRFDLICSRSDYCVTGQTPIGLVDYEVCVAEEVRRFEMEIDQETGFLESYNRLVHCFEFQSGGPSGKYCSEWNPYCPIRLRDNKGQDSQTATSICRSADACRPTLDLFGYSKDEATALCPNRTLNDYQCKTYVGDPLQQACTNLGENMLLSPDCSNVDACAVPSCQLGGTADINRSSPLYPNCAGVDTVPAETPPANHILSCEDALGTESKFDECVYRDGAFRQQQEDVRACRECLVLATFDHFDSESKNCTGKAEETCSVFTSCVGICGSCAAQAYDLLSCMAGDIAELASCNLNCDFPPELLTSSVGTMITGNGMFCMVAGLWFLLSLTIY